MAPIFQNSWSMFSQILLCAYHIHLLSLVSILSFIVALLVGTLLSLLVFKYLFSPLCSLQLIVSNVEGKSSPSEVLVCTTNPDKPCPPSTPKVIGVTPNGFTVTWGNYSNYLSIQKHTHTVRWESLYIDQHWFN